jgi:hypothetical protein
MNTHGIHGVAPRKSCRKALVASVHASNDNKTHTYTCDDGKWTDLDGWHAPGSPTQQVVEAGARASRASVGNYWTISCCMAQRAAAARVDTSILL